MWLSFDRIATKRVSNRSFSSDLMLFGFSKRDCLLVLEVLGSRSPTKLTSFLSDFETACLITQTLLECSKKDPSFCDNMDNTPTLEQFAKGNPLSVLFRPQVPSSKKSFVRFGSIGTFCQV